MRSCREEVEAAYRTHEASLPIVPLDDGGRLDAGLVTFGDNKKASDAHGWFHFKEGFSRRLLPTMLEQLGVPKERTARLLDPFAGVGTTLLSAQLARSRGWRVDAVGVECNPFLCFVADAKLDWQEYDPERVRGLIRETLSGGADTFEGPLPEYSTLRNPRVYHPLRLRSLLGYREKISQVAAGLPEQQFLLLGYAAVLEAVSGVRKDGRALRFVSRRRRRAPREALRAKWSSMLETLESMHARHDSVNQARMLKGDGRQLEALGVGGEESFDLIMYSPPYLNNIDYTEVYKIELWMLGFVQTYEQFRELRRSTLASHPGARFARGDLVTLPSSLQGVLDTVAAAFSQDGYRRKGEMFKAYAFDMLEALRGQFKVLKQGGHCVCVVGNSLHGGEGGKVPVATDLLVALAAQSVGFTIDRIFVARHLRRRDRQSSPFLRESILLMEKPG